MLAVIIMLGHLGNILSLGMTDVDNRRYLNELNVFKKQILFLFPHAAEV